MNGKQNHYKMRVTFRLEKDKPPMNQSQDWDKYLEQVGQHRDKTAFTVLFKHFSPHLKYFLLKSGSQSIENVEELVQETMVKVWRKAGNYSAAKGPAGTWIFTIARNTRIDAIRRQTRQNPELLHADDIYNDNRENQDAQTPASSLVQLRSSEKIGEKLHELPVEQSEVLKLMYFQGKSGQQVANELRLPLGTVKSRIRLALAKMKLALSPIYSDIRLHEGDSNDQ